MRQTRLVERAGVAAGAIRRVPHARLEGGVGSLSGLLVGVAGLAGHMSVGDRLDLVARDSASIPAEIVGFRDGVAQAMAFGALDGLGPGSPARSPVRTLRRAAGATLAVSEDWLGRVIDPLGRPLDGRGALLGGPASPGARPRRPPAARARASGLGSTSAFGRSNCFARVPAGPAPRACSPAPGIGKSTLLAMLAAAAACDVVVLALVGERGREVREFIEDDLGRGAGPFGRRGGDIGRPAADAS